MTTIEETAANVARKTVGKASGKGKRQASVKLTASGAAGKEYTDAKSNMTVIGGTVGKGSTIATCNEIAALIGVDGKRFRGWLRSGKGTGNDGRYTRRVFNLDSDEVKALIVAAKAALRPAR